MYILDRNGASSDFGLTPSRRRCYWSVIGSGLGCSETDGH